MTSAFRFLRVKVPMRLIRPGFGHFRHFNGPSKQLHFSSLASSSQGSPLDWKQRRIDDDVQRRGKLQHQQRREFLIPVVVVGVVGVVGWIAYRRSQGKSVAPDKALEAQEAYKQQQEALQKRNHANDSGGDKREPKQ